MKRLLSLLLLLCLLPAAAPRVRGGESPGRAERRQRAETVQRGLEYLVSIQADGPLGEARPRAVTSLFLLACLSSGVQPDHPLHGKAVQQAYRWLLHQSSRSFLGGLQEPNADHAFAALTLASLVGTAPSPEENLRLHEKARGALEYSLEIQDRGMDPAYAGGWRPNDKTSTNDRVLSAWFLLQLRAMALQGEDPGESSLDRAVEFIAVSQKGADAEKSEERGGFSVGAAGLTVRSATAAGTAALALFDPDPERLALAQQWLASHPPRWYGPHFFTTNFFAVRGLYRSRHLDDGASFREYFRRVARLLRERQEADGSIPFPPGHGGPLVAMGRGYSTAMAILILNVDRGCLPVDQ